MTNFDFLFYSNPQPMWIFDTNTLQMLEVNTAALQEYGYTKEEFLNLTIWDLRADKGKHDLDQDTIGYQRKWFKYPRVKAYYQR